MDGHKSRSYGYLMTGSQYISYACWGNQDDRSSDKYFCARYQLAIGIFPYSNEQGDILAVFLCLLLLQQQKWVRIGKNFYV